MAVLKLKFAKVEATGNDFVYIDRAMQDLNGIDPSELAQRMCDRHRGIGADGLLLVSPFGKTGPRVNIYNADGSVARTCGNGIRGAAAFLYGSGYLRSREFHIMALSGKVGLRIDHPGSPGVPYTITTTSRGASFESPDIPFSGSRKEFIEQEREFEGNKFSATAVFVGNPHLVLFVDHFDFDLEAAGRRLRASRLFKSQVNVNFVRVQGKSRIEVRTFERGVGLTLSCASGSTASVAAAFRSGRTDDKVRVKNPGGELHIEISPDFKRARVTGTARLVCLGEYYHSRIPSESI